MTANHDAIGDRPIPADPARAARAPRGADPVVRIADEVCHDLGNLLAVIAGQTSLIQPFVRADPDAREALLEIRRSVTACVARLHELAAAVRYASSAPPVLGQPAILLAVADPSEAGLIGTFLTASGYRVTACPVLADALAHVAREPVDLLIVEAGAASHSERDVAETLRAERPRLPALVLFERSTPPAEVAASGPTEFLKAPFVMADLAAAVRRLLDSR
jgi:CheY-like chemotaxis protein